MGETLLRRLAWPSDETWASSHHRAAGLMQEHTSRQPASLMWVIYWREEGQTLHSTINPLPGVFSSNKNQIPIVSDHFNNEIVLFNWPEYDRWEYFSIQRALLNGEDVWGQGCPRCPVLLHIYQRPALCKMPEHNSTVFLSFLML